MHKLLLFFAIIFSTLSSNAQETASSNKFKEEAALLIKHIDTKKGLCIYLSASKPERADFPVALAQESQMLIHGLLSDKAVIKNYNEKARANNVSGQLMFEVFSSKKLPYLSNLAKLIIIDDVNLLKSWSLPESELLRVLAPKGVLAKKVNGKWVTSINPRPSGMDEWTHPHHGPDANLASTDTEIKLPLSVKWVSGTPTGRGGFGSCASTRAVIAAGGRIFTIGVDDKGDPFTKVKGAVLLARDAYSGLFLWKINCERSYGKVELDWRNVWPIVATDKRVYSRIKDAIAIIDAVTGKILKEYKTTYEPSRLILSSNTVITSSWEKKLYSKAKDGFEGDNIRRVWWPSDKGTVEAFDAITGQQKWKLPIAAVTIIATDNTVYALQSIGNPPTKRDILAIDINSGKIKWQVPHTLFGPIPDTFLNFANKNFVVVSKTKAKNKKIVSVLSAKDGKLIYTIPDTSAKNIIGNELWCLNGRYDLKTGKKISKQGTSRTYAASNGLAGCIPPVIIAKKIMVNARSGHFTIFSDIPKGRNKKYQFKGARGACLQGMVPANGMLYTAQNNCACVGGQIGGFMALANHQDTVATPEEMTKKYVIEKGEAFGSTGPVATKEDWPTYRYNIERSGGNDAILPEKLKIIWSKKIVEKRGDTFQMIWNSRFGIRQPLSQPIIVNNIIYTTAINLGEISALETKEGKKIWTINLPSRIDSPPTYHKGLLYVGCHDGWVYAFKAKDGKMAYRIQIAPKNKSIVAHGMVESLWPVAGSILIHNDIGYAMAGRSAKINGGLVITSFKVKTGEQQWSININKGSLYRDTLMIRNNELGFCNLRFDLKTGKQLSSTQSFYKQTTMIDASWSGGFSKRSGRGFHLGKVCNNLMSWNSDILIGKGFAIKKSVAIAPKPAAKSRIKHPDRIKQVLWRASHKPHTAWARVNALTTSKNIALYAGDSYRYATTFIGNSLWIHSAKDGKLLKRIPMSSKACVDSFAISNQRAYLCLQDGNLICLGEDTAK